MYVWVIKILGFSEKFSEKKYLKVEGNINNLLFSILYLFNFNNSSEYSFITLEESTFNTAQTLTGRQGGAVHTVESASDGIQFFMESGNIDVANFKLYGLVK